MQTRSESPPNSAVDPPHSAVTASAWEADRSGAGVTSDRQAIAHRMARYDGVKAQRTTRAGLVLASLMVVGCSKVAIGEGPHWVVAEEPVGDEVAPYVGLQRPPAQGPLLAFQFNSGTSNLRSLAKWRDIHHLYFVMSACPTDEQPSPGLFDGPVHEVPTTDGIRIPHRYKAYIPLNLKEITQRASVVATLDVAAEVEKARAQGLCLRLGGGAMWGSVLESNAIRLPLAIIGDELRVTPSENGGARAPKSVLNASVRPVTPRAEGASVAPVRPARDALR